MFFLSVVGDTQGLILTPPLVLIVLSCVDHRYRSEEASEPISMFDVSTLDSLVAGG